MKKKIVILSSLVICMSISLLPCFAQEKTKEEIKALKEEMKAELKAQAAIERKAKIEKLSIPKPSGVASVDDLASGSGKLVLATSENNKLIPELYKRTIGETVDGVTDVTVKKPTLQELVSLADNITTQIKSANDIAAAIPNASNDISSAGPLKAPKATKALNFVKETSPLVLPELQSNLKVVNDLIVIVKSSKNN